MIELKGIEFENKGAELMLIEILRRIEEYWPDSEVAITPSAKSPYKLRAKLGAWQKLSLRKSYMDLNLVATKLPKCILKNLKSWGIVTESEVDVILDAAGFSYSDQWGADLRVRHAAAEAKRLKKRGGKYIFLPQAMGPFERKSTRSLIENGFTHAALVCARDLDTYNHLVSAAGNFGSLRIYKDFTNAVEGVVPSYFVGGENKFSVIPNKNMINPRNKNNSWIKSYIDTLVKLTNIAISFGLTPFFLNHEGREDGRLIDQVLKHLDGDHEVINESDPLKVKGIIQASRLSICSRYHGCISALSSGNACIGTSWSHKYERLYEEYQAQQLLITPGLSDDELKRVFELALNKDSEVAHNISKNAAIFKSQTEEMWQEVRAIIDSIKK